jgi:tetratricopeptide (TPR) repeat protein
MTLTVRRAAAWFAVLIAVVWLGGATGSFHFDDSHSVESNLAVRSLKNIPSFWTDPSTSSFIPENRVYRPLVYTFYSFCWLVGGGATWPFHVMKMGMHFLVVLALFLIWRRLFAEPGWLPVRSLSIRLPLFSQSMQLNPAWAAFFLATLFAIHPAAAECVDYISATTSLQCAMFYVWAYLAYLSFRDGGDRRHLLAALFLYFLSVASKEEGITLPAMVFVTEAYLSPSRGFERLRSAVRAAVPFVILGALLAFWIVAMRPASGDESRGFVSPLHYFMTQWRAYLWYMRLWFWPFSLNADEASVTFSTSFSDPLFIQAAIGNFLLVGFAWVARRKYPAMLFGLLWFYITISPASSVVVLAEAINEHRMYLAYIGFVGGTFSVLLPWAESFFPQESRARQLGWLYAAVALGLVIGAQERNRVWLNDENLWADTVEKNPTSGRALNNLALVYMGKGENERAVDLLGRCEQHWGSYMYCALNKGIAFQNISTELERNGKKEDAARKLDEAERSLLRAFSLAPRSVHVNFHLARFFEETRRDCARAIPHYRASVEFQGGRYPAADIRLAVCSAQLKKLDDARASLDRALQVEPTNESAMFERGKIEFEAGNLAIAQTAYLQLLERNPNHVQAWYNYGVVQLAVPNNLAAQKAFENTVRLDPKSEQGWFNLAFAAEKAGDKEAALKAARELVGLQPARPEFQTRLKELERKFASSRS